MGEGDDGDGGKDPLAVAVGGRVAALRAERGWELGEVAGRTGMSDKYVWRVEAGLVTPGLRNLARLAAAFGVSLSALLEGVGVPDGLRANRPYVATRMPGRPRGPAAR